MGDRRGSQGIAERSNESWTTYEAQGESNDKSNGDQTATRNRGGYA